MKKLLAILLVALMPVSLCACRTQEEMSEETTEKATEEITEAGLDLSSVTGLYFREEGGFGGAFTLSLLEDGSYSYYEGALSSYIGFGEWTMQGNRLILTEHADPHGNSDVYLFDVTEDGSLVYVKEGSDQFMYIALEDGDIFARTPVVEAPVPAAN